MSPIQVNDITIRVPQLEIQEFQAEPSHIHFIIMPSIHGSIHLPKVCCDEYLLQYVTLRSRAQVRIGGQSVTRKIQ